MKDVAKANGYLGESVYARMDQETRREVQEALLIKDKMIGASVMLYAAAPSFKLVVGINLAFADSPESSTPRTSASSSNSCRMPTTTSTERLALPARYRVWTSACTESR